MGKVGPIGEAIEIIQEEAEKGLTTAKQQITGKPAGLAQGKQSGQSKQGPQGSQAQGGGGQASGQKPSDGAKPQEAPAQVPQSEETKSFVKDMYASQSPPLSEAEMKEKELEDKKKQEELRQRLHSEYYQRLVNPPKQQEERSAEKIEREEEEKKMEQVQKEEEEKKKELPVVVTKDMGTKEKLRGVSG